MRQREIAEKVGLTRSAVTKIVGEVKDSPETRVSTTTAAQELQAKQAEVEALRRQVAGVPKSEIAGAVGLSRRRTQEIVQGAETAQAPDFTTPDLTVTAKLKDEIEALRRTAEAVPFTLSPSAVPLHNGLHGPSFPRQHRYPPGTN